LTVLDQTKVKQRGSVSLKVLRGQLSVASDCLNFTLL